MEPCNTPNCVRAQDHAGVCTAAPSARTLDWDQHQADKRAAIDTLNFLDIPTPYWADLND